MWPHPEFRVNVMTEDGTLFGNAQAAPPNGPDVQLMEVTGVSYRDSVAVGTPVFTSGLGGIWPRGIAVGTVLSEAATTHSWERTYLLLPSVHPASLSHVIVLLEPMTDLRELFARDSTDAP
jgi:rod shape-determining protein MreC